MLRQLHQRMKQLPVYIAKTGQHHVTIMSLCDPSGVSKSLGTHNSKQPLSRQHGDQCPLARHTDRDGDAVQRHVVAPEDSSRWCFGTRRFRLNFHLSVIFVPLITLIEIAFFVINQSTVVFQSPRIQSIRSLSSPHQPRTAAESQHHQLLTFIHPPFAPSSQHHHQQQQQHPVTSDSTTIMSPKVGSSMLAYRPDKRTEIWRYLLYMLVHTGWQHLLLNALVQLLAGIPLEIAHGAFKTGIIYLSGVLAGSLATAVFDTDAVLVGSSSGVYSMVAAHLPSILLNYGEVDLGTLKLATICIVVMVEAALTVWSCRSSSFDLPSCLLSSSTSSAGRPSVSYVAHFAGAVTGLLVGLFVLGPSSLGNRRSTGPVRCHCPTTDQSCCLMDSKTLIADRRRL